MDYMDGGVYTTTTMDNSNFSVTEKSIVSFGFAF